MWRLPTCFPGWCGQWVSRCWWLKERVWDLKRPFKFMKSHLLITGLISQAIGVLDRKFFSIPISWSIGSNFFSYFWVSGLIWFFDPFGVEFCAGWEIMRLEDKDFISFFYIEILRFSRTICWRCCFAPVCIFGACQISSVYSCMDLYLDPLFLSVSLDV